MIEAGTVKANDAALVERLLSQPAPESQRERNVFSKEELYISIQLPSGAKTWPLWTGANTHEPSPQG